MKRNLKNSRKMGRCGKVNRYRGVDGEDRGWIRK